MGKGRDTRPRSRRRPRTHVAPPFVASCPGPAPRSSPSQNEDDLRLCCAADCIRAMLELVSSSGEAWRATGKIRTQPTRRRNPQDLRAVPGADPRSRACGGGRVSIFSCRDRWKVKSPGSAEFDRGLGQAASSRLPGWLGLIRRGHNRSTASALHRKSTGSLLAWACLEARP